MLFDSHSHLNFKAFNEDRSAVMSRCIQAGMKVLNVGAAASSSQAAVDIADSQSFYAALGLHPIHVFDEEFDVVSYQKLITAHPDKIVAMGETGFDYWHLQESLDKGAQSIAEIKAKQKKVFLQHVELAKKNNLALVVHGRNGKPAVESGEEELLAYQDIYNLLKDINYARGVIHCYGGNLEQAKLFTQLGFYLGFTGIVTFDKTGVLEEILKWMPMDKILIETDAPYLAPIPYRGKRNEPVYVQAVAQKIAQIKDVSAEEMVAITGQNAMNLFNIK